MELLFFKNRNYRGIRLVTVVIKWAGALYLVSAKFICPGALNTVVWYRALPRLISGKVKQKVCLSKTDNFNYTESGK